MFVLNWGRLVYECTWSAEESRKQCAPLNAEIGYMTYTVGDGMTLRKISYFSNVPRTILSADHCDIGRSHVWGKEEKQRQQTSQSYLELQVARGPSEAQIELSWDDRALAVRIGRREDCRAGRSVSSFS